MSDAKPRRWFITGVSTGLGRDLALAAVRGGHRVMGSVRQPDQIAALASDGIDAVLMDVNDQAQVEAAASAVVARMGGVDVLVNNAGFGLFGALEALSMDEIRGVMETNFFGVLRVTKALLPTLRQSGGMVVNMSSMAGQIGMGGATAYCASKFALEGMSEALAEELAPFSVRVLIVEPGAFRTDFSGRSVRTAQSPVADYAGTQAGDVAKILKTYHGHEPGDPVRAAQAIVDAVLSPQPPLRLPLGADAVERIGSKLERLEQDMTNWREASLATAFAS